ncbi:hypothetical protein [Bradyrhizobium sp. th.b2]|uniref:hypothetical protein n=1 Tax=Bradyrhizobium sp. th-b2 TaxID=172088 RepID=UPI0012EC6CEA|nr:hypothetical protein [Bradyrhizobium sp. th.b2]
MIPDGIELFQLRQRRSASGDTFFTGRFGAAFVVLVRDEIERDLWRMVACDPTQTHSRDHGPSPARAIAPPIDDDGDRDEGDAGEEGAFDELPSDLE